MTDALTLTPPFQLLSVLIVSIPLSLSAAPPSREAPNPTARPADQLSVSGNACGPAALLSAFRFGNGNWQRAALAVAGETDKQQITMMIRQRGLRPSNHLIGKPRWGRHGVNLADLRDIANEMTAGHFLPEIREDVFFASGRESPQRLLRRVHGRLETSLERGLPPVLSIRRYALRNPGGNAPIWTVSDGHFVTVIAVPKRLSKGDASFPVTYIDPWGGKIAEGTIEIPRLPVLSAGGDSPCLEANFPGVRVGTKGIRNGERTTVVVSAAIGRW